MLTIIFIFIHVLHCHLVIYFTFYVEKKTIYIEEAYILGWGVLV